MSTIIKFDLKELRKLVDDKDSCVIEKKVTQNLALQPWCLGNLKESIKNLLDYKIGKFDKEFNGIILSYKNLRVLQNIGSIRNDNADIHFQVQADYFIFRPFVGATLKGIVNKKNITHLGIIVHRVFNVVIPRPTEEPGNKWIGSSVQEGQQIVFRIVVLDLYGALPYIRGELDESSLKSPESDDIDFGEKVAGPINASYIHFEKTKPFLQKQGGDGLSNSPEIHHKNRSPNTVNSGKLLSKTNLSNMNMQMGNEKQNLNKTKKIESETNNTTEKIKSKRLSKLDTNSIETKSKQTKKSRKHV